MKKILLVILMVTILVSAFAGEKLNDYAVHIKNNYQNEYEQTIKKYALIKWGTDYSMVVYEINKQSESLGNLITKFKSENTNIVFKAIQKWSINGYLEKNILVFREMTSLDFSSLLKMNCDWSMVLYEYDKQSDAMSSF